VACQVKCQVAVVVILTLFLVFLGFNSLNLNDDLVDSINQKTSTANQKIVRKLKNNCLLTSVFQILHIFY